MHAHRDQDDRPPSPCADEGLVQELRALCRSKDEMLANAVHEIRSPLTTIVAALGILADGMATSEAERGEFVGSALAAARHLMLLCNDMLDAAAFDAGRLRIEAAPHDLAELLREAEAMLRPLAVARGLQLRFEPLPAPVQVFADGTRCQQVVFNLVGNALKYSRPGGHVVVRATRLATTAAIEVEDDGIGVPIESRSRLFTKFSRLHAAGASQAGGTGIGLYLCRVLVERMGGCIGYDERSPAPGSVFWFTLPLHAPAAVAAARA